MATLTFYRLPVEKRTAILYSAKREFEEHALGDASVKHIVEGAAIPRGSFYQYFKNLEDCFFTVLQTYTVDTHQLFLESVKQSGGDLKMALAVYGSRIREEIYRRDAYELYKSRYLHWTQDLEQKYRKYLPQEEVFDAGAKEELARSDKAHFLKAVVHDLVKRAFVGNWSGDEFLVEYQKSVNWITGGLFRDGTDGIDF